MARRTCLFCGHHRHIGKRCWVVLREGSTPSLDVCCEPRRAVAGERWEHVRDGIPHGWDMYGHQPGCWCNFINHDPRPDPASPCGFEGCREPEDTCTHVCPTEEAGPHDPMNSCHPHVPTACLTCHHPIRRVTV